MTPEDTPTAPPENRLRLITWTIGDDRSPDAAVAWLNGQKPDVVMWQQLPAAAVEGMAGLLGMTSYPAATGPPPPSSAISRTGLLVRTVEQGGTLQVEPSSVQRGTGWHPLTAVTARLVADDAPCARPWHLASERSCHYSATIRKQETQWHTDLISGAGGQRQLCTVGGAWESYPVGETPAGIANTRLRAWRTYIEHDLRWPDDRPDAALTAAGYVDAARWARDERQDQHAADPTDDLGPDGESCGGPSRTHRVYLSRELAPAIAEVRVSTLAEIEHAPLPVRVDFDTHLLTKIMNGGTA